MEDLVLSNFSLEKYARNTGGYMQRVELACHTGYSREKGIGFAEDWIRFAASNGIKTIGVTDIGNVDGYTEFQQCIESNDFDIKLIMGADLFIYVERVLEGQMITSGRLSVLVQNETGKENLYKILSEGEKKYKREEEEPKIPLGLLLEHREGLLIGSGSSKDGLVVDSIKQIKEFNRMTENEEFVEYDRDIYNFLDYIEIPNDRLTVSEILSLLELAEYYNIPAVVSDAPYYMTKDEEDAYSILNSRDNKHYHTTEELLKLYEHLGKEEAYELVVTNSNLIANMCEIVPAIPDKKCYPFIDNQDEILKGICEKALTQKYPKITAEIRKRLDWELEAIQSSESAFMFLQIKDVMDRLELLPFEVGARGSVGSSIVAYLCGISEVDPIKANLSPYFFFGYNGEKEPDIALNFRVDIQEEVHKAFAEVPGVGKVIKVGTFGTIGGQYAETLIDKHRVKYEKCYSIKKHNKIIENLDKCVRTKGQHPGGIIMLPRDTEIEDICPVSRVEMEAKSVDTTAFDYHTMCNIIYKLDALGHDSTEIIKRLYDLTGADPRDIRLDDPEVMGMFMIKDGRWPACVGIPEFSSEFVHEAMKLIKPKNFNDLVKVAGLMHGTDTWLGNAELLVQDGKVSISEVIADRNDIFDFLKEYGITEEIAFEIAEEVRKGRISRGKSTRWENWKRLMLEHGVPDWFIWSCKQIKYLYPRAHAYAYVMNSWRMAWYKLHYPLEFYKVMLDVSYGTGFEMEYMAYGKDKLMAFMEFLRSDYSSSSYSTMRVNQTCRFLYDYYDHGFQFKISEGDQKSNEMFRIIDNHTIEVKTI